MGRFGTDIELAFTAFQLNKMEFWAVAENEKYKSYIAKMNPIYALDKPNIDITNSIDLDIPYRKGLMLNHRKKDNILIYAQFWMGWHEEHWDITEKEFEALPLEERAKYEVQDQLNIWAPKNFGNIHLYEHRLIRL